MTIFCLSPSVCMPKAINILWKHLDISWDNIRAGGCNMKISRIWLVGNRIVIFLIEPKYYKAEFYVLLNLEEAQWIKGGETSKVSKYLTFGDEWKWIWFTKHQLVTQKPQKLHSQEKVMKPTSWKNFLYTAPMWH